MSIHYDAKLKRFRDSSGRLVSRARARKSSIARAEYQRAQRRPSRPKPQPKGAVPKVLPKAAPKLVKKTTRKPTEPTPRAPQAPWERQGVVREYPDPDEWFPDTDHDDYDYGYDDLIEDWGDYGEEDTDS